MSMTGKTTNELFGIGVNSDTFSLFDFNTNFEKADNLIKALQNSGEVNSTTIEELQNTLNTLSENVKNLSQNVSSNIIDITNITKNVSDLQKNITTLSNGISNLNNMTKESITNNVTVWNSSYMTILATPQCIRKGNIVFLKCALVTTGVIESNGAILNIPAGFRGNFNNMICHLHSGATPSVTGISTMNKGAQIKVYNSIPANCTLEIDVNYVANS